jgi:hypothetical protein
MVNSLKTRHKFADANQEDLFDFGSVYKKIIALIKTRVKYSGNI